VVAVLNGNPTDEYGQQHGFAYRFEWGRDGLGALAAHCAVVVVIDVLRFTSAVCCALESGATVLPYRWNDANASAYAIEHRAVLAGRRESGGLSLSPTDLLVRSAGARIVLPSPNGATLVMAARRAGVAHVLAGSLRNATATARTAKNLADGRPIAIIAAGERWAGTSGPLRPCVEDLLGAGAVLAALDPSSAMSPPRCSPEAAAARAAFIAARGQLLDTLLDCPSGRELVGRGWDDDVATSAALDVATIACVLDGDAFVAVH
jgi:2-phosphosulfolactate phosphatase